MLTIQTHQVELTGSNYEIGYQLGKMTAEIPPLKARHTEGMAGFDSARSGEAADLFDLWCPGLTQELSGFADALEVRQEQVLYYAMTYLTPRCSQIALLPDITAHGKPLLARNYEFSHEAEDFSLVKTAVKGKYAHLGTGVLHFGRDDGLNEHGLAVTMSSCGFPVGALPGMRAPKLKGLQFWAVIRALLENCRDVDDGLRYLKGMPIAYNLNLILLDKSGRAALFETLDGRTASLVIGPDTAQQMLHATNHAVLPDLAHAEPRAMAHSVRRYEYIRQQLRGKTGIAKEELKAMLLSKYPEGLCCHAYQEFFGTTKSMILSPAEGSLELCWGGRAENGWHTFRLDQPLERGVRKIQIALEKAAPGAYDWQPTA